jgi:hypothetical protein
MKTVVTFKKQLTILILGFVLFTSCDSLKTALYDHHSYEQSISLKVEANSLISNAFEPFSEHQEEVTSFLKEFEKLKEYEKNKANNELSYQMIQLIGNPDKNLLGGFLKRWKEKNTLSKFFIDEAKTQVNEAFDVLIKYESKKDKEEITNYLSN